MKIQYDKDFEKVMNELQANFGWSNIDELPDSYKDLLNDTIKAVKNCSIPAVVGQSELLFAFIKAIKEEFADQNWDYLDFIADRVIGKQ